MDVAGDVFAAESKDCSSCSSLCSSGSRGGTDAVREAVGELTVDVCVRRWPDAADAYEYICCVSILAGILECVWAL